MIFKRGAFIFDDLSFVLISDYSCGKQVINDQKLALSIMGPLN